MRACLRWLLWCVMVVALPFHGAAMAAMVPMRDAPAPAALAHGADAAHGADSARSVPPGHATHATHAAHATHAGQPAPDGPCAHHDAGVKPGCSACASCSATAVWPVLPELPVLPRLPAAQPTWLPLPPVAFLTDGPDRPPRSAAPLSA